MGKGFFFSSLSLRPSMWNKQESHLGQGLQVKRMSIESHPSLIGYVLDHIYRCSECRPIDQSFHERRLETKTKQESTGV